MDLDVLAQAGRMPAPFTPGEELFWDDPHISAQMLAAHLDPQTEAASRPAAVIERATRWLVSYLALGAGSRVLDLGCGPGLYCERFSRHGLVVTGIDYSRRSIGYARAQAARESLAIHYVAGNYLHLPFPGGLDAVFLIYGDLCVLPPQQRDALLDKVRASLRDGGHFICDVSTRRHRQRVGERNSWAVREAGFWRPEPHLLLTQGFDYPAQDLYLDQYVVITADGRLAIYRNWFQDYTLEAITAVLTAHGFALQAAWSDLEGTSYDPDAEWISIAARTA